MKTMASSKILVSIIMPVYNAEQTIQKSVYSVLSQTYPCIELLLIDDASKDDSLSLLKKIETNNNTSKTIRIIHHQQNKGVAVARNTGLEHATGKYIYWVDADDWIEKNAIELLVEKVEKENLDIVGCNWYLSFLENERLMHQPDFVSPEEGLKKLMHGIMRWNLWLFMTRRDLFQQNNIRFLPDMNMGEDMMVTIKLFALAQRVAYVDTPLYHYAQVNSESLTQIYSQKHIEEVTRNIEEVENFLSERKFHQIESGLLLHLLKLNIKLPLLFTGRKSDFRKWRVWFSDSNIYVMKNKMLPLRTRILQWFGSHNYYVPVKLYHIFVTKLVYGCIYK